MPGPTKYSPNKEVVLKRVINLVNLDRSSDNYSMISQVRANVFTIRGGTRGKNTPIAGSGLMTPSDD